MSDVVREWHMSASFLATREQAEKLKETLATAAAVFFEPTQENASALFTLGAEAIVSVAAAERDAA